MSPYVTQYIFWSFTSGGAEMFMPDGMGDVYLRWFCLHSAGVSLCIPPVALAELPALFRPRFGTFTCGATKTSTSGGTEIFMPNGMGCLPAVLFAYTRREYVCVYLRWLLRMCLHYSTQYWGHLPAVLGDVYLRCFRLHSARVCLCIPPVAPADVPANTAH